MSTLSTPFPPSPARPSISASTSVTSAASSDTLGVRSPSSTSIDTAPTTPGLDQGEIAAQRFAAIRAAWLTPRPSSSSPSIANPTSSSSSSSNPTPTLLSRLSRLTAAEKATADAAFSDLVRGYDAYQRKGANAVNQKAVRSSTQVASEGCYDRQGVEDAMKFAQILKLAKQLTEGNKLSRPLGLRHAVGILYRGWEYDGTIPRNYVQDLSEEEINSRKLPSLAAKLSLGRK